MPNDALPKPDVLIGPETDDAAEAGPVTFGGSAAMERQDAAIRVSRTMARRCCLIGFIGNSKRVIDASQWPSWKKVPRHGARRPQQNGKVRLVRRRKNANLAETALPFAPRKS